MRKFLETNKTDIKNENVKDNNNGKEDGSESGKQKSGSDDEK